MQTSGCQISTAQAAANLPAGHTACQHLCLQWEAGGKELANSAIKKRAFFFLSQFHAEGADNAAVSIAIMALSILAASWDPEFNCSKRMH